MTDKDTELTLGYCDRCDGKLWVNVTGYRTTNNETDTKMTMLKHKRDLVNQITRADETIHRQR